MNRLAKRIEHGQRIETRLQSAYHYKNLRVCGPWSVKVEMNDGTVTAAHGEFCEIAEPNKLEERVLGWLDACLSSR